ncbi:MAG: BON domain-containing protein [Acidobacteriota bacterium]
MPTDRELQEQIVAALDQEPDLDVAHIGVIVHKGIATLAGEVATVPLKSAAEETTRHVAGVRAVANDLDVVPGDSAGHGDSALAEAVVNSIVWRCPVPQEAIQATVDDGEVVLSGAVTWPFQKIAAERAVQQLSGVKGIANHIVVKPRADVEDVKARIAQAFQVNADIDAQHVRVEIRGGAVVLTGTVRSAGEREQAGRAAWSAAGVTHLDNRLVVAP